ncbi:hypothetical protein F5X97DRAFT_327904 [Nemania serpens]|nr:hypothetical protein F5X97DRAFT_327904 [Nemania serpens]
MEESEDGGVTIAFIGFLDNLSGLLNSTTDSYSNLSGRDLIARNWSSSGKNGILYYAYYATRPSWDPLAGSYAVHGLGGLFKSGNGYGYDQVDADGTNQWIWYQKVKNQFFLRLAVNNGTAVAELHRLFLQGHRRFRELANDNTENDAYEVELRSRTLKNCNVVVGEEASYPTQLLVKFLSSIL